MKINHETKIRISIVTDFNLISLDQEIVHEEKIKIKEIIAFIDQTEKTKGVATSFYENSFTASFDKSIICLNILDPFVSWDDIMTYKNIHDYYERM